MASEEFNDLISRIQELEREVKSLQVERKDLRESLDFSQRARGEAERREAEALEHEAIAKAAHEHAVYKMHKLMAALRKIVTFRKAKDSKAHAEQVLSDVGEAADYAQIVRATVERKMRK